MGNIISQNSTNYFTDIRSTKNLDINNTKLGDFVREWTNIYDDGLKYGKQLPEANYAYDNLLKKRACCTNQTSMKVNLPLLQENKLLTDFQFGTVSIQVINDKDAECTSTAKNPLDTDPTRKDASGKNYRYNYKRGTENSPNGCVALYGGEPGEKPRPIIEDMFCDHVKMERKLMAENSSLNKQEDKVSFTSYGKYYNDGSPSRNGYIDCNCANSAYYDYRIKGVTTDNIKSELPGHYLAQLLDNKCNIYLTQAYTNEKAPNINCFQLQSVQDNEIKNSIINADQDCKVEQINNATDGTVSPNIKASPNQPIPTVQNSYEKKPIEEPTDDADEQPDGQKIDLPVNYIIGVSVFIVVMFIFIKFFI